MKKQIILIMTDTTRKDMLGCYGNPKMITPIWTGCPPKASGTRMPIRASRSAARPGPPYLPEPFRIPMGR